MKEQLSEEHKAMLKFIHEGIDGLYKEMKETLQLDGENPNLGQSLNNAVNAQRSFDLVSDELFAKHRGDGNICPIILGASLTKMLVNALHPQILPDGKVLCSANMGAIVKSFSTMAALPLAMLAWDNFISNNLDKNLDEVA